MLPATPSSAQTIRHRTSTCGDRKRQRLQPLPKEPHGPQSTRRAGAGSLGDERAHQPCLRRRSRDLATPGSRRPWPLAGRPGLLACRDWISPAIEPRCPSCLTQSAPTTGKNSQRRLPQYLPEGESSTESRPYSISPAGVPRQQQRTEAGRRCRRCVPRAAKDHSFPNPLSARKTAASCRQQNRYSMSAASNGTQRKASTRRPSPGL